MKRCTLLAVGVALLVMAAGVLPAAASDWNPQVIPFLGTNLAGTGLIGVIAGPHLDLLQVKNVQIGLIAGAAATGEIALLTKIDASHIGPGAGVTAVQEQLKMAVGLGYTRADKWFGWVGKSVFEFNL